MGWEDGPGVLGSAPGTVCGVPGVCGVETLDSKAVTV